MSGRRVRPLAAADLAAVAARPDGGSSLWWTALPTNARGRAFHRAIGATGEPIRAFALTFDAFDRLDGEQDR